MDLFKNLSSDPADMYSCRYDLLYSFFNSKLKAEPVEPINIEEMDQILQILYEASCGKAEEKEANTKESISANAFLVSPLRIFQEKGKRNDDSNSFEANKSSLRNSISSPPGGQAAPSLSFSLTAGPSSTFSDPSPKKMSSTAKFLLETIKSPSAKGPKYVSTEASQATESHNRDKEHLQLPVYLFEDGVSSASAKGQIEKINLIDHLPVFIF